MSISTTHTRRSDLRIARVLMVGALAGMIAVLAGCTSPRASSGVYNYGQAQREQIVRLGTVISVRDVVIQDDKNSGMGVVSGGAMGGVLGNAVGGGSGRAIAVVGGALIGALAGNVIENQLNRRSGYEITVQFDNGEIRAIAQEADVQIAVGQRVQVISGGGPTRIAPV